MFSQTTHGYEVSVRPIFLREHSVPEQGHYVWAYHVMIQNHSGETAQLLNRYWRITDAQGLVQEVRGPGVVGQHPELSPGKAYEYNSFTHLPTPTGHMEGTYEMKGLSGNVFQIEIPRFELAIACRLVVSN